MGAARPGDTQNCAADRRVGLGGDDGSEIYIPNLNPNFDRHIVLVKEAFDAIPGSISHEWGIYFAADPSTLLPVLTSTDFDNGQIVDLDALSVEATFPASLDPFGFYIKVEFNPGFPVIAYSQAALNPGGLDWYASFPFLANPLFREVAFEVRGQLYSLEIVDGALVVPEPATLALFAGGIALLAARGQLKPFASSSRSPVSLRATRGFVVPARRGQEADSRVGRRAASSRRAKFIS